MTVDLDAALHDHFAAARAAELPPGSWERLEARLADPPGTGDAGRPRRRVALVGVAAAVLVVAGMVALVVADDPEDQRLDAVDAPTTTEAPATTPVPPPARPETVALLVDGDGDGLGDVAVMAPDGSVRTLVAEADDDPPPAEGGASGAVSLDVAPDGVVYYEVCCEPAVGAVHAYDPATDADLGLVTHGEQPTVSPDGRSLAVSVQGVGIQVVDLATGGATTVAPEAGGGRIVTDLAWSPDGTRLAVEHLRQADGVVVEVGLDLVAVDDGTTVPVGDGLAMPAFLPDGRLVVATGARADDTWAITATGMAVVDPETAAPQPRFGLLDINGIDTSADGGWVVVTDRAGAVRVFDGGLHDQGTWVGPADGVIAAAW